MGFGRLAGSRRFLGVPSSRSRGRGSTVRLARARLSIGRRVLRPCPSPPGRRVGTVESRGGFDRRLTLRLRIREVRILTDVEDDRVGEEAGEVFDKLGRERTVARGGRRRAAGLVERVTRGQGGLHVLGRFGAARTDRAPLPRRHVTTKATKRL